MSLFLIAVVQSLLFAQALSQGSCKETSGVDLTFYGFPDGHSDQTSFPCGFRGNKAGGTGSYSDPESFATAQSNPDFKNCDIVYIPYFQKYFQYLDHCVKCDQDFGGGVTHLDLWIGGSTDGGLSCEQNFGAIHGQTIIHNPPPNLPVNSVALWDGSACHDASSPNPAVFANPSTSGLCSGGTSPPSGGSSSSIESTLASMTPSSTPASTPIVIPTPTSSSPPTASPEKGEVQPPRQLPSPSSTGSSSITQAVTPTTLLTSVVTSSSSVSASPTTSSAASKPNNTSDCASWHGCLGDPCETYNDCAGDWICMGSPKTCHDNMKD